MSSYIKVIWRTSSAESILQDPNLRFPNNTPKSSFSEFLVIESHLN